MFKEQWEIKPPPVSERRLCFRAVPLLCVSEGYNKVHLGLERHAWDKGAANSAQQCMEQVFPLPLGAFSDRHCEATRAKFRFPWTSRAVWLSLGVECCQLRDNRG